MFKQFNNLPEKTIPDDTDILPIQQTDGTTWHIKRENFLVGVTGSGGGGTQLIQLLDSRSSGTLGGSATIGAWTKRAINTIALDQPGTTTLNNNIFTLDAGTYDIDVKSTYYKGNYIRTRLFNVTSNIVVPNVFSVNGYNGAEACSFSHLQGRFILSNSQDLAIEYRVSSSNGGSTGLGEPCSFGTNEIYLLANIWKVG